MYKLIKLLSLYLLFLWNQLYIVKFS